MNLWKFHIFEAVSFDEINVHRYISEEEKDQSFKRTRNNRNNIAFNFADNSFIGDSETRALHIRFGKLVTMQGKPCCISKAMGIHFPHSIFMSIF